MLSAASVRKKGATVFGYVVNAPEQYGVIELDGTGRALSIEEKPKRPKSNVAVTGLYFYDNDVVDIAAGIKPSPRGEIEITDVNKGLSRAWRPLCRGARPWFRLARHRHPFLAGRGQPFRPDPEQRQGLRIACPEEIALRQGYISLEAFARVAQKTAKSSYGEYLLSVYRSFHGQPRNAEVLKHAV